MTSIADDVVRRLEPPSSAAAEAEALAHDLRVRGFDLRRPVFVAFLVELAADRDDAYHLWRRAADEGWRSSLYADGTGWVVRLGRLARARADALMQAAAEAEGLATTFGGALRGVCAEDLSVDDAWTRLADRVRAGDAIATAATAAVVPLPQTA